MARKGPYVKKINTCIGLLYISCSRGHSVGHFDTKVRCLAQFLTEVIANSLIKNMHPEKPNLLSKLISKFYIQFHIL